MTVWENARNVLIPCCSRPWPDTLPPSPPTRPSSPAQQSCCFKGLFNMQKMRARALWADTRVKSNTLTQSQQLSDTQSGDGGKRQKNQNLSWHIWAGDSFTLSHSQHHPQGYQRPQQIDFCFDSSITARLAIVIISIFHFYSYQQPFPVLSVPFLNIFKNLTQEQWK